MNASAGVLPQPAAGAGGSGSGPRVWLVHDWLTGMRGGEKVLLELARMFPQAKIATLFHVPGTVEPELEERIAAVSCLQRVPQIHRRYRALLPLMPLAVKTLRLDPCDLVISVSHCVAKGVTVPPGARHACYCLTPMRYIWNMTGQYFQAQGPSAKLQRRALAALAPALRVADVAQNQHVDLFIGNSNNVAQRINRFYHRPAVTVYSPIDETFYAPSADAPGDYYLVVSALVPYKRVDLAVRAFASAAAAGRKLVIIGKGPQEEALRAMAATAPAGAIRFLSWQDDAAVRWHYQHCRALLFPGEEDFGLVPLEVQACGRPVIAYGAGGVLETVVPLAADAANASAATGVFFYQQTAAALLAAIETYEAFAAVFAPARLAAHAASFGRGAFRQGMHAALAPLLH